jgi:hypothetical protein
LLLRPSSGWDGQHHRSASVLRALADDYDADLDAFHERKCAERYLNG